MTARGTAWARRGKREERVEGTRHEDRWKIGRGVGARLRGLGV